ncbi:MAG: hypothetical protein U0U09_14585 [Cyclobacteriaceae bacterium]
MKTTEQEIKAQYAKVFTKKDWRTFKNVADWYFRKSAMLRKKHIDSEKNNKLLIRNIQKRLYLGIGTELLVKACYLKSGLAINKPIDAKKYNSVVIELDKVDAKEFEATDTFTLDPLLNNLNSIFKFDDWKTIERGLKILKVFRNKEGHVAVNSHEYKKENYEDIEKSIISIYQKVFGESLEFKISMEKSDKGKFKAK